MARSKAPSSKQKARRIKPQAAPTQQRFIWALVIALLTAFVYSHAINNQFIDWDDYTYVVENPYVQQPTWDNLLQLWQTPVSLNYHPITMTSLALNLRWFGPEPSGFIAVNISFHALNTFLVFLLIWRWSGRQIAAAAFCAILFGLHPMHVESVAWVSERKDVLYVFFFLLSLLSYERYRRNKQYAWLAATFGLFTLACLSKAMAVVLPVVLLLVDYWRGRNLKEAKPYVEKLPFFLLSLFFGAMAISVQGGGDFGGLLILTEQTQALAAADTFTPLQRLQFASYGFVQYILRFLLPVELSAYYPYPSQEGVQEGWFILSPILFVLIWVAVIASMWRTKLFAFGIGFYFVTVALVLQFLSVGVVVMANRYTYLPYLGLAFIVGMGASYWIKQRPAMRPVFMVTLGILALVWSSLTWQRIEVWQNTETLWSSVIEQFPDQEHPYSLRGNYYGKLSRTAFNQEQKQVLLQKAMADFNRAVELGSTRPQVYEGMGNVYGSLGQPQKALEAYQQAIRLAPNEGSLYINRAIAHSMLGNSEQALADYQQALALLPQRAGFICLNRGILYVERGAFQEALADFNIATQQLPNNPRSWYNRGVVYLQLGQAAAAKQDFQRSLQIDPNFKAAQQQLQQLQ